jgi:hypothetical protein
VNAAEFRRLNRAYGERVPHDQISAALANAWRFADDAEEMVGPAYADGSAIMLPPLQPYEMESTPCAE